MKILLINNFFPPQARGGAERVVADLASRLVREGNDVAVAALSIHGAETRQESSNETVRVYRVRAGNLYHLWRAARYPLPVRSLWLLFMMFNPFAVRRIQKIIERENPDLVWTHNLYGLSFLIPRMLRRKGVKHRHTLHDIQLAYPSGILIYGQEQSLSNRIFLRQWYERITRWLFSSPDEVYFPSQWLMGFYKSRGFFPLSAKKMVPNFPSVDAGGKLADVRVKNPQAGPQLLFVGQIEKQKGILFLLKALNKFKIKNSKFKINIVGSGSVLGEAKRMTVGDGRISFFGSVPHEEMEGHYNDADLVVVPSLCYENAPTVIYESLAHRVPVLASRIGGIPEHIRDGEDGWLFEPGDERDLLRHLDFLLT